MLCDHNQQRLAELSVEEYQRLVLRLFQELRAFPAAWYEMARAVTRLSESEDTDGTENIDRMVLKLLDGEQGS